MKKIVTIAITVIIFWASFSSCQKDIVVGNGPVVTETRSLNNFRGVSYKVPGKVNFKIDPVYKVAISAQRNILDVLRSDIVNGVLIIDFKNNVRAKKHEDIIVNITAPSADYFSVSGVGDMIVEGDLVSDNLSLNISGVGNIFIQKATVNDKINADISGSGNMDVTAGSAKREELRISGSGNMDLSQVPAEKAETHISGSGDMKVNLSQSLDAYISGSGTVYYRGRPAINTHISGSGNVKSL
ncbi:MAG: head GIN domain-containing protein [Ginsengibacter sp.]